jgi:hypothetical protein
MSNNKNTPMYQAIDSMFSKYDVYGSDVEEGSDINTEDFEKIL